MLLHGAGAVAWFPVAMSLLCSAVAVAALSMASLLLPSPLLLVDHCISFILLLLGVAVAVAVAGAVAIAISITPS